MDGNPSPLAYQMMQKNMIEKYVAFSILVTYTSTKEADDVLLAQLEQRMEKQVF